MMPAPPIVSVSELRKTYDGRTILDGVSLAVDPGEIVGVVGPNGAGKTTLIECVEGLRTPDSGTIEILGHRPEEGPWAYNPLFGAQLQEASLPARLRVREALRLFASFYDDPYDLETLMARTGLTEISKAYFRTLSGGQKRRVLLAVALVGRPPLVIFDEPTTALDPRARVEMWSLIRGFARLGTAMIFTTHDMAEAEEYADRVYMLDMGAVIASGRPKELLHRARLVSRVCVPARDGLAEWLREVPGYTTDHLMAGTLYGYGDAGYSTQALRLLEEARLGAGGLAPGIAGEALIHAATGPARMEDLYLISTGVVYEKPST